MSNAWKTMPVACSCAMVQVIKHWPLTTQAQVKSYTSPGKICAGQSDTETGFCLSISGFPCQYHSTKAPSSFIHVSQTLYNPSNRQHLFNK